MHKVIDIACSHCSATNTRSYGWIDPKLFSDKSEPVLTSTFFCVKCYSGNSVKIKFLSEQQIEIEEILDFKPIVSSLSEDIYLDKQEDPEEENFSIDEI